MGLIELINDKVWLMKKIKLEIKLKQCHGLWIREIGYKEFRKMEITNYRGRFYLDQLTFFSAELNWNQTSRKNVDLFTASDATIRWEFLYVVHVGWLESEWVNEWVREN